MIPNAVEWVGGGNPTLGSDDAGLVTPAFWADPWLES